MSSMPDKRRRAPFFPSRTSGVGVVVLVFGLLLWARLILITGHPRSAIADPKDVVVEVVPAIEPVSRHDQIDD